MTVHIAFQMGNDDKKPKLLRVYKKSSYQAAYNWLADTADVWGGRVQAGGEGNVAAFFFDPATARMRVAHPTTVPIPHS